MNFKAQIKRDLKTVFHNEKEFADIRRVYYNNKEYRIPIIIDHNAAMERKKPTSNRHDTLFGDHADGIFASDLTVYISAFDMNTVPRKETRIEIGDECYEIIKVIYDAGEIILDLEMLDD